MISDEYTVVLLFDRSDAYGNLITQAFSTTGSPHLLKHLTSIEAVKEYLSKSLEDDSSEKYIKPRLIILSAESFDDESRELLRYIKTHSLLKLIPVIVFCSEDCDDSIGKDYMGYLNSFVKRKDNQDEDKEIVSTLASYWLKWNNLPV